jgi:hypothetical protein
MQADPDLSARVSLLRSINGQFDRDAELTLASSSIISTSIGQNLLLKDPVTASIASSSLTAEIDKFTAAAQRLHSKTKGASKVPAASLLRTCVQQVSHRRLITEFQAWGQQLVESIKRDTNNGNGPAAREASAALADMITRCA